MQYCQYYASFDGSLTEYMIEYSVCNGGLGYASETLTIQFNLPSNSNFEIMKIGVFGVDEATDECSDTPMVTFDSFTEG